MKKTTQDRLLEDASLAYKAERAKHLEFKELAYALRKLVWAQRLRYPVFFLAGMLTATLGILLASQAFSFT